MSSFLLLAKYLRLQVTSSIHTSVVLTWNWDKEVPEGTSYDIILELPRQSLAAACDIGKRKKGLAGWQPEVSALKAWLATC